MCDNIILIGMPGSGKSTYGVVLAKKLGYAFLDTDLVIQEKYGKLLWELIVEKSLDGFLAIEEEVNASIQANHTVIAPGGSVIYGTKAMEHFREIGRVVYLDRPMEYLRESVGDTSKRGVAMRPGQTFLDLYEERTPLYQKYADITIPCEGKTGAEIVEEMYHAVRTEEIN